MTHERAMLTESAAGVIARHAAAEAEQEDFMAPYDRELWTALAEHGFTLVAVPEEVGGAGAGFGDAAAVVGLAGETAVAVPLAETLLASWLLVAAGMTVPAPEPLAIAPDAGGLRLSRAGAGWHVAGRLARVPWARDAAYVVALAADTPGPQVICVPAGAYAVDEGANMAGEARDDVEIDAELEAEAVAAAPPGVDGDALRRRGALVRAVAMAGALRRARELTVEYVGQREQFGRPLSRFQAVQHQVAELVAEVAAADAAVEAAVDAEDAGRGGDWAAVAKIRAGRAAGTAAAIAHQLHGAIGVTDEYELHRFTRRLWSWRDEFGSEASWSIALGGRVAARGADALWPGLTAA